MKGLRVQPWDQCRRLGGIDVLAMTSTGFVGQVIHDGEAELAVAVPERVATPVGAPLRFKGERTL